jgi:XTP/dITP diphosphohydrolase
MTQRIVLATHNAKKVREIAPLLAPHGFEVVGLNQLSSAPPVDETGVTFAENAAIKATAAALATGEWSLADDSGLMVDALGGRPGVYSARYAGPDAVDEDNNDKLLEELGGVPDEKRGAQYVCHLSVADPTGAIQFNAEGRCRGRILHARHGVGGFGYDPLFLLPEYHCSFGELSFLVKSQLSHRARALQLLIPLLVKRFAKP